MSTYRERRLAKAARLREWAAKREARDSTPSGSEQAVQQIPFGQPILVGHHSERRHRNAIERADNAMRRRMESLQKAEEFQSRADNIEAAADHAIYSDDVNAAEELRERIAALEAERSRVKAYNATCRKGSPDLSLLTEADKEDLARCASAGPAFMGEGGAFPRFKLSNISGNISRNKKRLAFMTQR